MDNKVKATTSTKNFDIEELNKCTLCTYKSHVKSSFRNHLLRSHGLILKNEPYPKKVEETELLRNCPNCDKICPGQKKLSEHLKVCEQGRFYCGDDDKREATMSHSLQDEDKTIIVCLLCPFKSVDENFIVSHYLDEHNLFCKIEKDPDFDQALDCAPYTLQRPVEVDTLPNPNSNDIVEDYYGEKKEDIFCQTCNKEFLRKSYLGIHMKNTGHLN